MDTAITPMFQVPCSHIRCHIQPVQWLLCFAQNSSIISLSAVFSEGRHVCVVCTHMSEWGRPHYCVYGGLNLCEHEGKSERGGRQRQKERERRKSAAGWRFSFSFTDFFPAGHENQSLKVLVTPKQFNHCFDNSDSSRHSSSSCRTWTTVDLSVWYGFH